MNSLQLESITKLFDLLSKEDQEKFFDNISFYCDACCEISLKSLSGSRNCVKCGKEIFNQKYCKYCLKKGIIFFSCSSP